MRLRMPIAAPHPGNHLARCQPAIARAKHPTKGHGRGVARRMHQRDRFPTAEPGPPNPHLEGGWRRAGRGHREADAVVALAAAPPAASVCGNCGTENAGDSRFCRLCGAPGAATAKRMLSLSTKRTSPALLVLAIGRRNGALCDRITVAGPV